VDAGDSPASGRELKLGSGSLIKGRLLTDFVLAVRGVRIG
jgi:hypothetical protein